MEAVRVRSIETAFQYDMEIAIQRAAEEMLSQQQQLHSQSQQLGSAKRIAALEEELAQVQQKLADCEDQLKSAKDELSTLVDRNAVLEKEIASRIESSLRNEQRAIECSRRLEEETRLRKDLEMELEITIRNRSEVIRELESVAEQRCARLKEHYTAEVNSMRAAMIFTDQNLEKAVAEAAALRNANKALIDVSVEVTQLRATVAELRRAAAASSSAIAMSSVPVSTAFGQLSQTSTAALSVYESLWPELIDIGKKAIKQSLTAVELYSDSNRLASKVML
jgi:chromosome segregation ATPase